MISHLVGIVVGSDIEEVTIFVDESAGGVSTNWGSKSGQVVITSGVTNSFFF